MLAGLSFNTDDSGLKDAFSGFGEVVEGEFYESIVVKYIFIHYHQNLL